MLCDQGLVTLNEDPGYTGSESDSPSYTAPERFSEAGQEGGNSYPLKESDIYSFALSLYHVSHPASRASSMLSRCVGDDRKSSSARDTNAEIAFVP